MTTPTKLDPHVFERAAGMIANREHRRPRAETFAMKLDCQDRHLITFVLCVLILPTPVWFDAHEPFLGSPLLVYFCGVLSGLVFVWGYLQRQKP